MANDNIDVRAERRYGVGADYEPYGAVQERRYTRTKDSPTDADIASCLKGIKYRDPQLATLLGLLLEAEDLYHPPELAPEPETERYEDMVRRHDDERRAHSGYTTEQPSSGESWQSATEAERQRKERERRYDAGQEQPERLAEERRWAVEQERQERLERERLERERLERERGGQ